MYGKIFEDLYCSTLMDYGGDTVYVFISMIVLSDENGVIKHTAESLSRLICKDVESVRQALQHLESQDPRSNLKAHGGRRIVPLYEINEDETRGWLVVNKSRYRDKKDLEEIRAQTRERVRRFRERNADVTLSNGGNAEKRHTDTDTDTKKQGAFALPSWLPMEAWDAWLEVRKKTRAPNTTRALRLAIAELSRLKAAGQDVRAVLEQSTLRGWRGVFEVKGPKAGGGVYDRKGVM